MTRHDSTGWKFMNEGPGTTSCHPSSWSCFPGEPCPAKHGRHQHAAMPTPCKQTNRHRNGPYHCIYIYYVSIELFICPNYKGLVTGHFFTLDLGPGIKTFELYVSKDW